MGRTAGLIDAFRLAEAPRRERRAAIGRHTPTSIATSLSLVTDSADPVEVRTYQAPRLLVRSAHVVQQRVAVAIQDFLVTHHVFTTAEFSRAFPNSQTDRNLLSRAVHSGKVERVRRGVYVSTADPFSRTSASPFDVAAFACTSALQLHGVLHNLTRRVQFWTVHKLTSFTYDNQDYIPHRPRRRTIETQTLFTPSGRTYCVTTREQTLLDCLDQPSLVDGLGAAQVDLDPVAGVGRSRDPPRRVR